MKDVVIIGGGLSGLITSFQLAQAGVHCTLFERKSFPFHRVCGEYISNETVPFLKSLGLFPDQFDPCHVTQFQLTSVNGKSAVLPLDLGGFGISRYTFDNFLFEKASAMGVDFRLGTEVESVRYDDRFTVTAGGKTYGCDLVIGSFGKRSKMDISLGRQFIKKRSPYIGVKYHIRSDHEPSLIALHNFKDGYCGISNIEDGKTNLCYLSHRKTLKKYGTIANMEEAVLFKNPFLKSIFRNSDFLFAKPETINEISFETKSPVEDHILMTGDAAGMIAPLCGNGMAMAIHSSKILSELIIPFCRSAGGKRDELENRYAAAWNDLFARRLWTGRQVQRLFGSEWGSDLAVSLALQKKTIAAFLIKRTHGQPF